MLVAVVTSLMAGPLVRYCVLRMKLEKHKADVGIDPPVDLEGLVAGVPRSMIKEV